MATIGVGFIGLGNMGAPIAARIASSGFSLKAFDVKDIKARAPFAAHYASSVADAATDVGVVFLCLPAAEVSARVIDEVAAVRTNPARVVVETSTIGPSAAHSGYIKLRAAGIGYVDAPVSGGVSRAQTGELSAMAAGADADLAEVAPIMSSYAAHIHKVGPTPGQGQAMKLANNFASIACMLATSEAIAYGERQGLAMEDMLAVMNGAAAESFVTKTLFPKHIVTGAYDSAASAAVVWKDLSLFVEEAGRMASTVQVAKTIQDAFREFMGVADPGADWLHIYEFIRDGGPAPRGGRPR